jgi:hypothetical protein
MRGEIEDEYGSSGSRVLNVVIVQCCPLSLMQMITDLRGA